MAAALQRLYRSTAMIHSLIAGQAREHGEMIFKGTTRIKAGKSQFKCIYVPVVREKYVAEGKRRLRMAYAPMQAGQR